MSFPDPALSTPASTAPPPAPPALPTPASTANTSVQDHIERTHTECRNKRAQVHIARRAVEEAQVEICRKEAWVREMRVESARHAQRVASIRLERSELHVTRSAQQGLCDGLRAREQALQASLAKERRTVDADFLTFLGKRQDVAKKQAWDAGKVQAQLDAMEERWVAVGVEWCVAERWVPCVLWCMLRQGSHT